MSGHTPGPWEITEECGEEYWIGETHYLVGPDVVVRSIEDARLIAAAPELLDALKRVDDTFMPLWPEEVEAISLVRAAIAKATGEKQ